MKLWGGRFEEGPSEVFERFSGSLDFDRRLIHADIQGSQAFARALESVGILTAVERAQLVDAFDEMGRAANAPEFYTGATDEDVHTLVIRKLKEKTGGLADKIHTGRSRNEQVSLDTRIWLRDECDRTRDLLKHLLHTLLDLARKYPEKLEEMKREHEEQADASTPWAPEEDLQRFAVLLMERSGAIMIDWLSDDDAVEVSELKSEEESPAPLAKKAASVKRARHRP